MALSHRLAAAAALNLTIECAAPAAAAAATLIIISDRRPGRGAGRSKPRHHHLEPWVTAI